MAATPTPANGVHRRKIKVDMVSDAICPFCYIGYKNFEAGVKKAQESGIPLDFELEMKPFLLDPMLGSKPVSKRERYSQKFGAGKVDNVNQFIKSQGKPIGIDFSFGGTLSQTHDYHRLLAYAYKKGGEALQRPLTETLFTAYFEQEQDVGQVPTLVSAALKHSIFSTESEALAFFDSNSMDKEVKEGYRWAMRAGIQGVPFFVMNDTYAVSGAQPPQAFFEVFQTLANGGQFGHREAGEGMECPAQKEDVVARNEKISVEAAQDGKACAETVCPLGGGIIGAQA